MRKNVLRFIIALALLAGLIALAPSGVTAASLVQEDPPIVIYLFWGDGCPHCAQEKPFLEELAQRYPSVELREYEVWYNEENFKLFTEMAAAYGFEPHAVPTTFIGAQHWEGFSDLLRTEIENAVAECAASGCPDAGVGIDPNAPKPANENMNTVLTLPLIGTVDLKVQSLAVSTALIAFVDGFNPCSLWVLSILLALTLHTGSRKKVFIIGMVFLTVTSLVYVLFIAGLFTAFTVISFRGWIQVVVALMALFFAVVNIKDYFWYKEGLSFTIADEKKPGIYKSIRRVMDAGDSLWGLISATVIMSAGVSLVEFSCTAGFPVLWSNLIAAQEVTTLTFVLLLALYMLIYQIDELGIFLASVFTLKSSKIEEKHGRILKLIGGVLMLTLAVVMLVNPELMNDLNSSLIIFGIAFGATIVVLVIHRKILPAFGIHLGTETEPKRRKGLS